jgi:heat-inducible transcriptional repressor
MSVRPRDPDVSSLSEREKLVLAAIVDAHRTSGEPVSSGALAVRSDLGVSSQTIRNVMGILAERGLIEKPHLSAGRVPTASGLRLYVDSILRLEAPPEPDQAEIATRIHKAPNVESVVDEASRVLSKLSRHATLVRVPRTDTARLRLIELVRLRDDAMLVILVTEQGIVQNRIVELDREGIPSPAPLDAERLAVLSRALSDEVRGRTLDDARHYLSEQIETATAEKGALEHRMARQVAERALDDADPVGGAPLVKLEGEKHLLVGDDPSAVSRMRELYDLIDEKSALAELLDEAAVAPGIRIFIGRESGLAELAGLTVVAAGYGRGEGVVGGLGVIGPMHMDFARVVPLVGFTANAISALLRGKPDSPSGR